MEKVLIVDDNDRYANHLKAYLDNLQVSSDRAISASQGYEFYRTNSYSTIISDITMETQTSGLFFMRKVFREGYKGKLIIATTGFDFPGVMAVGKYVLPSFAGVGWMIPKVPLKKGEVVFFPTNLTQIKNPFYRME